jgi:hypothetical protein
MKKIYFRVDVNTDEKTILAVIDESVDYPTLVVSDYFAKYPILCCEKISLQEYEILAKTYPHYEVTPLEIFE